MGGDIFDPLRIVAGLRALGVPFVLSGDLAAMVHGADLTPSRVEVYLDGEDALIQRLGTMLMPLGAEQVDASGDPASAVFRTNFGRLECVELPPQTYRDLRSRAADISLGAGVTACVAAAGDLAVQRMTLGDLIAAGGAGGYAVEPSGDGTSPILTQPRGRFLRARSTVEEGDEYGPDRIPAGEGFFLRTLRAFERLDRFMTRLDDGSLARSRARRR